MPNSLLSLLSVVSPCQADSIVDGNLERDAWTRINDILKNGETRYLCCTVMPGPQLKHAVPICRNIRRSFPGIIIIWGGYFPSNHPRVTLSSGLVDYIVAGPGEESFPALINALEHGHQTENIAGVISAKDDATQPIKAAGIPEADALPALPYSKLEPFYAIDSYLPETWLGRRTLAYHSSYGCPFSCSFCGVVPVYHAAWKGRSALKIVNDLLEFRKTYNIDAVEFHDNNFFVSEQRTVEFAQLMRGKQLAWWAEGRPDTLNKYADETLQLMADSGCKMIFIGAESGSSIALQKMHKGGSVSGEVIHTITERLLKAGIIPEFSFVLGLPAATHDEVAAAIDEEIRFIRKLKKKYRQTEFIIYAYSPIPADENELFAEAVQTGFEFPRSLDTWISPEFSGLDMRKNPMTPWLTRPLTQKILGFETVFQCYYPTATDISMGKGMRTILRVAGFLRYMTHCYRWPYELKLLQKMQGYRHPDKEGF